MNAYDNTTSICSPAAAFDSANPAASRHGIDHIIVDKRAGTPHCRDVIVFVFPLDPTKDLSSALSRLVTIRCKRETAGFFLKGEPMHDPHVYFEIRPQERSSYSPRDNYGPAMARSGGVFMMVPKATAATTVVCGTSWTKQRRGALYFTYTGRGARPACDGSE